MNNTLVFFVVTTVALLWGAVVFFVIFPKFIFKINPDKGDKNILTKIQNNNTPLLRQNNGGKIGSVNFTASLLDVQFFGDGMIIKPFLFKKVYLLKSEITKIEAWKGLTKKGIKIEHSSNILKNPLIIYTDLVDEIKKILG